jgi:hypothetical protein
MANRVSDNTFHLSCWMTMAQIEKLITRKVMFNDLRQVAMRTLTAI